VPGKPEEKHVVSGENNVVPPSGGVVIVDETK
jgi:hypothetical protein